MAVLLSSVVAAAPAVAESLDEAPVAPDWALDDIDGASVRFHQHAADRPAVLLFWATWCPYCRTLMPHLEAVRADYAEKGVRFYALNVWEDGDPVAYMQEHGYGMQLMLAADLVAEDYGVQGTPGVYVTDREQRVRYVRPRGAEPQAVETALRETLDAALARRGG